MVYNLFANRKICSHSQWNECSELRGHSSRVSHFDTFNQRINAKDARTGDDCEEEKSKRQTIVYNIMIFNLWIMLILQYNVRVWLVGWLVGTRTTKYTTIA